MVSRFLLTILISFVLITSSFALEYKPGKKHLNKEGVVGLLLYLNGKMIEHVFKPNLSACMKSKRIAQREMDSTNSAKGARVIFACKMVKRLLQEDKQAKYGIRLLKIIE